MDERGLTVAKQLELGLPGTWTSVGWIAPPGLTFEEWRAMGPLLSAMEAATHWWIGDWLNVGEFEWGEMYAQAMDDTEFEYQTLRNDKWVSAAIQLSRRRDNLTWSHHSEVAQLDPEIQDHWLAQAAENKWSCSELRRQIKLARAGKAPPLPEGKYNVIYADPPWSYDNSGFTQSAASHYPTMAIEDICALSIGRLCMPETVLFLWATSPLLPEALKVIDAWGFHYKASMVWDKGKGPGIGWYVVTEHEFVLIGVREEATHPLVKPGSILRISPGRHSAKPTQLYALIEQMYRGPYCELFARSNHDGWTSWGNEL